MAIIKPEFYAVDQNKLATECLGADDPITEMRKERQRLMAEMLAQDIPVTMTFAGKAIATYYPDGSIYQISKT